MPDPIETTTQFSGKVRFLIQASNEPSVIIAEFQYALNEACFKLTSRLRNSNISYTLEDTFSDVYSPEVPDDSN